MGRLSGGLVELKAQVGGQLGAILRLVKILPLANARDLAAGPGVQARSCR